MDNVMDLIEELGLEDYSGKLVKLVNLPKGGVRLELLLAPCQEDRCLEVKLISGENCVCEREAGHAGAHRCKSEVAGTTRMWLDLLEEG